MHNLFAVTQIPLPLLIVTAHSVCKVLHYCRVWRLNHIDIKVTFGFGSRQVIVEVGLLYFVFILKHFLLVPLPLLLKKNSLGFSRVHAFHSCLSGLLFYLSSEG